MPLLCGRSVPSLKARVIIKNVRDAQAIGDNAQMIMVEQRARHLLNRRSNLVINIVEYHLEYSQPRLPQ